MAITDRVPTMRITSRAALRYFQPVIGRKPWAVKLGWGSFLTFEFGQRVRQGEFWRGTWHLWIYMCTWHLDGPRGLLIHSESPRPMIARIIRRFSGYRLSTVEIGPRASWTRLEFDDKYRLTCTPFSREEEMDSDPSYYWIFFMPPHRTLSVRPRNLITINRSDEPRKRNS
jgi:hypothetical protein